MGAWIYTEMAVGQYKDAKEAYSDLVDEAIYEHGHDPYNGTISTTDLSRTISASDVPRPGTKAFNKYVNKLMETIDKWSCVAIEIKPGSKYFKDIKNNNGWKGRKKVKAWLFVIAAAS